MQIKINRIDDNYAMEAVNEDGNSLLMDGSVAIGGSNKGMRPTQLLLSAVGGCSAIDIISILKKQKQVIESFEIIVDGEKENVIEYSLFRKIHMRYILKGTIDKEKAIRAAQLSIEKYCSVSKTLEPTAEITWSVHVNE
ncbi:MAG: OsmC family peroxiredoxin [Bacteroidetes bacterium]|nr:OsmC family peroxiredoxin [Bacteroidota bacterium]